MTTPADPAPSTDGLLELLRSRFAVDPFQVRPHDGGMNSRTWWVDSAPGATSYVAKWVPAAGAAGLRAGAAAADLAATSGVRTGAPVVSSSGRATVEWCGGALALLVSVEGRELGEDDDVLLGSTLARVHRATAGRTVAGALPWHWVDPDAPHLAPHLGLPELVADAVARLARLPPLAAGTCHGDPFPGAFLAAPDGSVGLIDWAGVVDGPLLYDVASAVMYLGGPAHATTLIASYTAGGGPAAPDLPHLETMLRFRWAVQADYFATRLAADDLTGIHDSSDNDRGLADARRRLVDWY